MREFEINIFDWLENKKHKFRSVAITTYSFDPIFFVHYVYPRLKRVGVYNVVLLVDACIYDQMMDNMNDYILEAINKLHVSIVRMNKGSAAFHPNVMFFTGPEAGAVCIGSGNMTFNGMSLNHEVWGLLSVDKDDYSLSPILCRTWEYILSLCAGKNQLLQEQLSWFTEYSLWLSQATSEDWMTINEEEKVRFIFNSDDTSVFQEWMDSIAGREIDSLSVISPYYDQTGRALEQLVDKLQPKEIKVFLDTKGTYPIGLIHDKPDNLSFYNWCNGEVAHRFHSKVYQVCFTDGTTQLLLGSANASLNGLGCFMGPRNEEACFLLENVASFDYTDALGFHVDAEPMTSDELNALLASIKNEPHFVSGESNNGRAKINIESAEFQSDKLTLTFSAPVEDGCYLQLTKEEKETIDLSDYSGSAQVVLECTNIRHHAIVALHQNGERISNTLLVSNAKTIYHANPNPAIKEASDVIANFEAGEDNIAGMLNYVFGYETDVKHTSQSYKSLSYSISTSRKENETFYTEEDFKTEASDALLSKRHPTMGIVDFLANMSRVIHLEIDGDYDMPEDDGGDDSNRLNEGEKQKEKALIERTVYGELTKYIRKVNKYFQQRLDIQEQYVNENKDFYFRGKALKYEYQFNDFILAIIALQSTKRYLKDNQADAVFKRWDGGFRDSIAMLCNNFIMLMLSGQNGLNPLYENKANEYAQDICMLMIRVLGYFYYGRTDKEFLSLTTMNILELAQRRELSKVVLDSLMEENHLWTDGNRDIMLAAVKQFEKSKELRDVDDVIHLSVIAYCKRIGFYKANHFEKVGEQYKCRVYHPGIKLNQEIKIDCGGRLRFVGLLEQGL